VNVDLPFYILDRKAQRFPLILERFPDIPEIAFSGFYSSRR
jgi:hypothetical protein